MSESSDSRISIEQVPETETHRALFDSTSVGPSMATVEIMACIYDTDPTNLPPLAEVLDPVALDLVCTPRTDRNHDGDRVVEFAYLDHTVRVKSYGVVEVEPTS